MQADAERLERLRERFANIRFEAEEEALQETSHDADSLHSYNFQNEPRM